MSSSSGGPPLPTLIVTGGASDGVSVEIELPGAEKTIGSAPNSHIRLTTRNVDAMHARVVWEEDGAVLLSDEGSASGTFVNGEKIAAGHVLQDGDRISIGPPGSSESVRLLVRVPPDLAGAAGPSLRMKPGTMQVPAYKLPAEEEPILFEEASPSSPSFKPAFTAPPPEPRSEDTPAIVFEEAPAPAPPPAAARPPAVAAAPAPPAPSPARPAPLAPPKAAHAPATKPDYMTEAPSIGGDRVREPIALPPAVAPAPRARRRGARMAPPDLPRVAIMGGAAALLSLVAFYAWSHLHQPPPVLSGITPPKVEVGSTVTIAGAGFAGSADGNHVQFGDVDATVTNASPTSLAVTVPAIPGANVKEVAVTVRAGGGRSNALFVKIARLPRITKLEPDVAVPGAEVTLHGQNLDGAPVSVRIGGEKVQPIDARADSLRVKVPDIPWTDGQTVSVAIDVGPDAARPIPLILGRLPLVLDMAPEDGPVGQRVTIKGRGFDPSPAANKVTFGGVPALVLAASATELRAAVPAVATVEAQTPLPVVVEARGATSAGRTSFTLSRALSGMVRLRFFPAPPPAGGTDRHALVSTQVAPVLLLTGPADAPSTAERADRVATALSTAMEAAITRPVSFEVREGATPAVAVSGGAVVVTATADDADGYAQGWEGGPKTRVTPKQIASYWAALLQDYATLFGQGQRSSRSAELSPRGRVFVDVYADAQRRGAAGGVPTATVADFSPSVVKTLREMALSIPTGNASAGVAVAGRWEGTMNDAEAERNIEVQLDLDGSKLAGSFTTKAGGLAVRTPLQQVTYDKGLLKFVAASGGAPRQFRGTLDGSTLAGSIFKDAAAKDKDAVGRFSLRYVE